MLQERRVTKFVQIAKILLIFKEATVLPRMLSELPPVCIHCTCMYLCSCNISYLDTLRAKDLDLCLIVPLSSLVGLSEATV